MSYEPNPDPDTLFQGDGVAKFVLPEPTRKALIARPLEAPPSASPESDPKDILRVFGYDELADAFSGGRGAIVVGATLSTVVVVSQSCDVQRKPYLTVAAVRPLRLIENRQRREDVKRLDRMLEYFALPAGPNIEESFVDLTLLYSVPRELLISLLPNRLFSMSNSFRQSFQWAIMQFFGRPAV